MKQKVFRKNNIWVGTMLGGPLAGGYFLYSNFKVFNKPGSARYSLGISIGILILLAILLPVIPDAIPSIIIPAIYTAIMYIIADRFQRTDIKSHIESGKGIHSWPRTILISVICSVITLGIFLFPVLLETNHARVRAKNISAVPVFNDEPVIKKDYGIQSVYYNSRNVSEEDADAIANMLYAVHIFNDQIKIFTYVSVEEDSYVIFFEEGLLSKDTMDYYTKMREMLPEYNIKSKFFDKKLDNVSAEVFITK